MFSYEDVIERNKKRINDIVNYNHTKRDDIISIAYKNLDKYFDYNIMTTWEDWITNPTNEKDFIYKVYIPLDYDVIEKNIPHYEERYEYFKNSNPPQYHEVIGYEYQNSENDNLELFDTLILDEHIKDIKKFRLELTVRQKIQHAILTIMKYLIEDVIEDYDTLWLDMDGYTLKYLVKIKYNYEKNKIIGSFTGIVIKLKLCTLLQYNNVSLDSPVKKGRCF